MQLAPATTARVGAANDGRRVSSRRAGGGPRARGGSVQRRRAPCVVRAAAPSAATEAAPAAATDADARRLFPGPLPPTGAKATTLVELKPGLLWALRQDFPESGPASIWLNCSVAKLSSGGLLVYSPVAPTPEMLEMVAGLGAPVEHIVAPSLSPEHWLYVNAFSRAHPDATVWVCPGLLEVNLPGIGDAKIAPAPNVKPIGPDMTAALGGEVDFALFVGPLGLFREAVVYTKSARAIFGGDLMFGAFEDEGMPSALQKRIGDLVGIRRRLGCPVAYLQMLIKREEGAAWARKIAGWDFDTVTGGHLSAGIGPRYGVDGKALFNDCFKFVL